MPGRPHRWRRFQSTHPLRGATRPGRPFPPSGCYFNPRTPCGVRPARSARSVGRGHFNPRTPCGVRPPSYICHLLRCIFQSTHPLRGATLHAAVGTDARAISIHAPLAGCDTRARRSAGSRYHFNPRTPCGVRLRAAYPWGCDRAHFNPRTPCGVRRTWATGSSATFCISIHAPLAGCDGNGELGITLMSKFQSTHPLRGATDYVLSNCYVVRISIHAPLAGCDGLRPETFKRLQLFQSTHPLRGATRCCRNWTARYNISIHAPLAGCDFMPRVTCTTVNDFNPRTPCGVRLKSFT